MTARRGSGIAAVLLATTVIVAFHAEAWTRSPTVSVLLFALVSAMIVALLGLAAKGRFFSHLPVAEGRVVAVVPAYNEQPEILAACIRALLEGSVVPDVIHVVDDGSAVPVRAFAHPRVQWHRQPNLGKRQAQVNGLSEERHSAFVLTIDSDSIVHRDALAHALRAMSLARVQAVTATCVVRNRTQTLLTRLTDLEVVSGNAVMRRARSVLGIVAPTSGPFALYRAELLFENVDDYLASGTYGDDRRLTHYALLRGEVVACDEAVVEMEMPSTVGGMFRQRTRWFQGYFRYLGWELRNLVGPALWFRVWNLVLVATFPVVMVIAFLIVPVATGQVYWQAVVYWIGLLYAHTLHYVTSRPGLSLRTRLAAWLFLTPLLVGVQWLVVRPAMYRAMTRLGSVDWVTRDLAVG